MRLKIPTFKICYSAMIISFINVIPIYFSDLQSAFVFLFSLSATFLLCITSYKLSVSKSIVFCMLDLLFSAIIECSMIIFDIFVISRQGFFFSNIRENSLLIILRAVSLVPCLIIYKISQFAMKNETNEHNITSNTYLIIVFNMAFLILFIYPNIVYFEHFELNLNQYILGYNVFIILLFIIYGTVSYTHLDVYKRQESAIRITHIPTGVVVACQNERSQHQNREVAMKMLKSKLIEIKERAHLERIEDIKGEQKDIGFGNQIRSYVFMPYTLVKDHRTGFESGNITAVMDGDIDGFINAYLKAESLGHLLENE